MRKVKVLVSRFLAEDDGPTSVEYAVLLALVLTVVITAVANIGQRVSFAFNELGTAF